MATKRTKRATTRRGWGAIRKLPSGRYQASYTGPDLVRYPAPITFDTQAAAEEWLALERRTVTSGDWIPPAERRAELERIRAEVEEEVQADVEFALAAPWPEIAEAYTDVYKI